MVAVGTRDIHPQQQFTTTHARTIELKANEVHGWLQRRSEDRVGQTPVGHIHTYAIDKFVPANASFQFLLLVIFFRDS